MLFVEVFACIIRGALITLSLIHLCARMFGQEKYVGYSTGGLVAEKVFAKWSASWKGPLVYTHLAWIVNSFMIRRYIFIKNARYSAPRYLLYRPYHYTFLQFRSIASRVSPASPTARLIINSLGCVQLVYFRHPFY